MVNTDKTNQQEILNTASKIKNYVNEYFAVLEKSSKVNVIFEKISDSVESLVECIEKHEPEVSVIFSKQLKILYVFLAQTGMDDKNRVRSEKNKIT